MAGGFKPPPGGDLGPLLREIKEIRRRLSELEIPTGTSMGSLVNQVQAKLAELEATVEALVAEYVTSYTYNTSQINDIVNDLEALIASPGAISPSTVNASSHIAAGGNVTGGTGVYSGGKIAGDNVWSNILTFDYRVVYVSNPSGELGHVPSSIRFKTDLNVAEIDVDAVLGLVLKTFKYKAAIEAYGSIEAAPTVLGLIAEEVADAGLEYLVYRGENNEVDGVAYERLTLPLLALAQRQQAELHQQRADIDALNARLEAIESQLQ